MNALKRFTLTATEKPTAVSRIDQARPSTTNSGFPGGCGIPMMCAVAMYSLVSQNAVVGASVNA
jgi:hypothetical protein